MFDFSERPHPDMLPCEPPMDFHKKPVYTMTEEVHQTIHSMRQTIDRMLRFEERLKQSFADMSRNLTSDNVIFKTSMSEDYKMHLQELKNEVNIFEGNINAEMELFKSDLETNYSSISGNIQKSLDEAVSTMENTVNEFKSSVTNLYNSFENAVNTRLDGYNDNHTQAFTDFQRKLTTELNMYEQTMNTQFTTFSDGLSESFETFETALQTEVTNRLNNQDSVLSDMEKYFKTNLEATVVTHLGDMETNGKFTELIENEVFTDMFGRVSHIITPELFGAVGDGETDDTTCLQLAVNKAIELGKTLILSKDYLITESIIIDGKINIKGVNSHRGIVRSSTEDIVSLFNVMCDEEYAKDIFISDIEFIYSGTGYASAIMINSCYVTFNKLVNLEFKGFTNGCIELFNNGDGVENKVYAHNIYWKDLFAYDCSAFIVQKYVNNGEIPWIYGGTIENVNFEGTHKTDNNDFYFDLRGFRNVNFVNIIVEGFANGNKESIFNIDNQVNFDCLYLEVVNEEDFIKNSFVFETLLANNSTLKNLYINNMLPILIKNDIVVNVSFNYQFPNVMKLLDEKSVGYLNIEKIAFGYFYTNDLKDNVIDSRNKYKFLQLGRNLIEVDDSKPLFKINGFDLNTALTNQTGIVTKTTNFNGLSNLLTNIDINNNIYSYCNITNNGANVVCDKIRLKLPQLKQQFNMKEKCIIVVTYKTYSNPYEEDYCNKVVFGANEFTYDENKKKAYGFSHAIIVADTNSDYDFTFDYVKDWDSEKNNADKQTYGVYEIAIFNGLHYGECLAKSLI